MEIYVFLIIVLLLVFFQWNYSRILSDRIAENQARIGSIGYEIHSINKFINEMSTPSAITPAWKFTKGQPPEIGSDTVVRVIMKDGQDIEAFPPFVYWQNSICYRVVSV